MAYYKCLRCASEHSTDNMAPVCVACWDQGVGVWKEKADRLEKDLSQAKADLAKEQDNLPSLKSQEHLSVLESRCKWLEARAERAEAELEASRKGTLERYFKGKFEKSEALAQGRGLTLETISMKIYEWDAEQIETYIKARSGKKALTPEPAKEER